jgi:hypothetical protein
MSCCEEAGVSFVWPFDSEEASSLERAELSLRHKKPCLGWNIPLMTYIRVEFSTCFVDIKCESTMKVDRRNPRRNSFFFAIGLQERHFLLHCSNFEVGYMRVARWGNNKAANYAVIIIVPSWFSCWLSRLLSNYFRFTSMELYSNLQQLRLSIRSGDNESSFKIM